MLLSESCARPWFVTCHLAYQVVRVVLGAFSLLRNFPQLDWFGFLSAALLPGGGASAWSENFVGISLVAKCTFLLSSLTSTVSLFPFSGVSALSSENERPPRTIRLLFLTGDSSVLNTRRGECRVFLSER